MKYKKIQARSHAYCCKELNSVITICGEGSQRENKKWNCKVSIYFHNYCMRESHSAASAICRRVSQRNIPKVEEKGWCIVFSTNSSSLTGRVPHPLKTVGHKSQSQAQGREREDTHTLIVIQESVSTSPLQGQRGDMLEQADWQAPGRPGLIVTLMLPMLTMEAEGTPHTCGLRVCCSH